jgi:hypothetical protein
MVIRRLGKFQVDFVIQPADDHLILGSANARWPIGHCPFAFALPAFLTVNSPVNSPGSRPNRCVEQRQTDAGGTMRIEAFWK